MSNQTLQTKESYSDARCPVVSPKCVQSPLRDAVVFHNQAYASKRWKQPDRDDISMPLVWSWSSSSLQPLVAWRRILCDRDWNEMFGLSPANLDWLCSFYCFERRGDTVKAHIGPGWRLRRLVCRCKCDLIYERPNKNKTAHGDYRIRTEISTVRGI